MVIDSEFLRGKPMNRILYFATIAILTGNLIGCNREPAAASANSVSPSSSWVHDRQAAEPKVVLPVGTRLRVALTNAVSSDKSRPGDSFLGVLAEPIVIDGNTVFAKGTKVRGVVVDAKRSGRVKGRASIQLRLTEIVHGGHSLSISTKAYSAVAESTKKRDAALIGGGAGL